MSVPAQQKQAVDAFTAIKEYVYKGEEELKRILPDQIGADRFLRVVLHSIRSNQQLMMCSRTSILQCLLEAARLGLEPTGGMGGAWLVPFRDKQGQLHAQLIADYRGLIRLALESGFVSAVSAQVVREGETFELERGSKPHFRHVPTLDAQGDVLAVYCLVRFANGGYEVETMNVEEVEEVRRRSKAADKGPWKTDWIAMARKTVTRRALKYVPLGEKVRRAIQLEDDAENSALPPDEAPTQTKASRLLDKIQSRRGSTIKVGEEIGKADELPAPELVEVPDEERGTGD